MRARQVTEFDQVEVHLTILQNIELDNIFRIFVDFLFDKPSDESRSTNGDAKALKALYCENLVVILGFQERTQRLADRFVLGVFSGAVLSSRRQF